MLDFSEHVRFSRPLDTLTPAQRGQQRDKRRKADAGPPKAEQTGR